MPTVNLRQRLFNAVRHGSRFRLAFIVVGLLAIVLLVVVPAMPRETRVSFRLPEGLRSLQIEYRQSGEPIRSARFNWDGNSPELLRHTPELAPGPTEVEATLRDRSGNTRNVRRSFDADSDRIARIDLRDGS